MKIFTISLAILLLSFQYVHSQEHTIEKEKWVEKPVIHVVPEKYNKESAVIVLNNVRVEYIDESKNQLVEYYTLHRIIHVNDDRGIEDFNKIYLGINEQSDVVDVKARTILPSGKIIELDKNNIKDLKEENGNVYKIFAMDGLEKGCDIEYFYTSKKPTSFFGRENVQERFPVLQSSFKILAPDRLRFEVKSYNFALTLVDTVINGRRSEQCDFTKIAGLDEEKYGFYNANLQRIEYRLSYNDAIHKGERLFTWNEFAKRIFGIYTFYSSKANDKIAALVNANDWSKLPDEVSKIVAVENYVKKNYSYNEELKSEDGNNLDKVMQNKVGGAIGLVRVYTAIFKNMGLNFQYVLTGDRTKFTIDDHFENWNNCDYPLFYFPAENKFLAVTRPDLRYPWVVPIWGDTNGLFCKSTSIGSFTTAVAEVKEIKLEDYDKSIQNIETTMQLNKNLDSLTIDAKQIFAGYPAVTYRDALNFSNSDQKRLILKEMAKMVSNTEHITFSEILNPEFENATQNIPLIIHTTTKSDELIEKAGSKLLLKIGLAIGPQVEMYQEKPRQEPINMDFGHVEERKISFIIPVGYKISNASDLKISQLYTENNEMSMGFVSDYEIKGNTLSVHIVEQYRKTFYPINVFDQFRKIINASSDFNKVVLVLEKI